MLIYLHGPDTFRAHETVQKLREKFLREVDASGVNITTLWGKGFTLGAFRRAITMGGFLATKRLIILRDIVRDGANAQLQKELVEALTREGGVADHLLVFWETTDVPKRARSAAPRRPAAPLLAYLEAHADRSYAFPPLTDEKQVAWIHARLSAQSARTPRAVAQRIAERCSGDLWRAASTADLLLAYADDRTLTPADVDQFLAPPYDDNLFTLLDAVGAQDPAASLRQLHSLLATGMNVHAIVAQLTRHLRLLLQLADVQATNASVSAEQLGVHPFVFRKASQQARRFTVGRLQSLYAQLFDTDRRLKTGGGDPETLLVRLVLSVVRPS